MTNVRIGTQVHTKVDPRINKPAGDVAMAFVTNVKEVDDETSLTLRVLLDTGVDLRQTQVKLLDGPPEPDDTDVDYDASGIQKVAWVPKD